MRILLYTFIVITIIVVTVQFIRSKKEKRLLKMDSKEEGDLLVEIWQYISEKFSKKK